MEAVSVRAPYCQFLHSVKKEVLHLYKTTHLLVAIAPTIITRRIKIAINPVFIFFSPFFLPNEKGHTRSTDMPLRIKQLFFPETKNGAFTALSQ